MRFPMLSFWNTDETVQRDIHGFMLSALNPRYIHRMLR